MEFTNGVQFWTNYLVTAWIAAMLLGGYFFTNLSLDRSFESGVVPRWPVSSTLDACEDSFHIVAFVHPKCVYSWATLFELEHVVSGLPTTPKVTCVFGCAGSQDSSWSDGPLWSLAGQLDQCHRVVDFDGVEAEKFGVQVSGHVLLFRQDGKRIFSGGVTSVGGQHGDKPGATTLTSMLNGHPTTGPQPPPKGRRLIETEFDSTIGDQQ